jgi:hypothetical protein
MKYIENQTNFTSLKYFTDYLIRLYKILKLIYENSNDNSGFWNNRDILIENGYITRIYYDENNDEILGFITYTEKMIII